MISSCLEIPAFNQQGSAAWHAERKGKLTASKFGAAAGICLFKSRIKLWEEYMGLGEEFIGNEYTEYGTECEPLAIRDYQIVTKRTVIRSGFVQHPVFPDLGASPDGLVLHDGSTEVKCRHDAQMYAKIPPSYLAQMYGVMACTGRTWCDFVSWAPGFGKWSPININIITVEYKQVMWDDLLDLLDKFWKCVVNKEKPTPLHRRPTWGK